jgi:hypothetical protein
MASVSQTPWQHMILMLVVSLNPNLPFESLKQPELLDNIHFYSTAAAAAARIVLMLFSSS